MSISVVHDTTITGATSGSIPSTTAGNCLVALIGTHSSGGTDVVTGVTLGGLADNFAKFTSQAAGVANPGVADAIWLDPNCAGGQTAIAIQPTTGPTGSRVAALSYIRVLEVSGLGATPTLDKRAGVLSTAGTTSWSSGATAATANAVELILGMASMGQFVGATDTIHGPASPWVNGTPYNDGGGFMHGSGYQIASATGAFTYAGTTNGFDFYVALVAAIAPSAGSDATVTGLTATATAAAPLGTVTGTAVVSGLTAQVSAAAPLGTVSISAQVAGLRAQASVTALLGTIGVKVGGLVATVGASAPLGAITGTATVTGLTAHATVAAPLGSIAGSATVTGLTARATVAAPLGAVSTTGDASVNGVVARATVAAPLGTPGVGVFGLTARSAVAAPVGTPVASVPGLRAQATVTAPLGTIGVKVQGLTAHSTTAAPLGTIRVSVPGQTAHATVAALLGAVHASATVTAPAAQVSVAALLGTVTVSISHDPIHLGGTEGDGNTFGGTAIADLFDGTAVADFADGTVSQFIVNGPAPVLTSPEYEGTTADLGMGGTSSNDFADGTVDGWTMQAQNITLGEFNDESLSVAITQNGSPFNLTGFSLTAYFKTAAGVADTDPSTITLSSTGGSPPITITNAAGGLATIQIPRADLANASITFWRLDVVNGSGLQNTAIYGTVTVKLL